MGLSYLYPLALAASDRRRRLSTVFEVTALLRLSVALFVAAALATGALPLPWITVAAVDGGVALFQIAWLKKGMFDELS